MLKKCGRCLAPKPLCDFYKNSSTKDGKQSVCKLCSIELSKERKIRNKKPRIVLSAEERKSRNKRSDANWRKNNPGKVNARRRNYEHSKNKAMPRWLTVDQRNKIKVIYEKVPTGHHVDHIVPLKGKDVCGLHVPWNLQYLPASLNLKKGNRF
jgi:hypothetical protein